GTLEFLYGRNTDGRGDQVTQFFWPASANYIADQPHVAHVISGHSYFTTCPDNTLVTVRQQLASKVNQVDPSLQVWQTEFGILGDVCGVYNGSPRNTTIDYGLYVAKVLHHDLAIANVTSWQWWLAMSPYNYSDALVYLNDPSGNINVDNCKSDGMVLGSKQLWAYGNFARFIRPGMKRVMASVTGSEDPLTAANSLMVSAYKDEARQKIVIVMVNVGGDDRVLKLDSDALKIKGTHFNAYTTDTSQDLKRSVMDAADIRIKAKSVVTLEASYQ
ncbi:MAG TPA: glycoside hydrolase, partial [Chryseosolibacter sp.]